MEKQNTLFGVEMKEEIDETLLTKENKKEKKPARKKGVISIHLIGGKLLSVDFEGYQEGSGGSCKDWEEVQEKISSLKKQHSEKYILEVIDEREKDKIKEEQREKCKLQSKEGFFFLNGIKINYKFNADDGMMSHFDFQSEKPNLISETGYRSCYLDIWLVNSFNSLEEVIKNRIDVIINYDGTGKKNKKQITYDLKFDDEYNPFEKDVDKKSTDELQNDIKIFKNEIEIHNHPSSKEAWKEHLDKAEEMLGVKIPSEPKTESKKIIVKIEYGLSDEDEKDFFISDNRREMGIETCLGGTHSSGWNCDSIREKHGLQKLSLEEKEKNALEWIINDIVEDGIPRENIEVVREEMNAEKIKQHEQRKLDNRKRDLELAEKDIENYSKKLKEALKIKYGYPVKIQVLKEEK